MSPDHQIIIVSFLAVAVIFFYIGRAVQMFIENQHAAKAKKLREFRELQNKVERLEQSQQEKNK